MSLSVVYPPIILRVEISANLEPVTLANFALHQSTAQLRPHKAKKPLEKSHSLSKFHKSKGFLPPLFPSPCSQSKREKKIKFAGLSFLPPSCVAPLNRVGLRSSAKKTDQDEFLHTATAAAGGHKQKFVSPGHGEMETPFGLSVEREREREREREKNVM